MKRSPIDIAIDRAVKPIAGLVMLRCRQCARTKKTFKHRTDPPNTAVVDCICDRCDRGDFAEVIYFDAEGRQLDGDGNAIAGATHA